MVRSAALLRRLDEREVSAAGEILETGYYRGAGGVRFPAQQSAWVTAAFSSLGQFPLVTTVVYYNAKDPVNWVSL